MTAGRSRPLDASIHAEVTALYADYAAALDERRYDDWVELFTEDCRYVLQPRENHERGLPLATMSLEGRGMLKDRVYGSTQTLFHAPYYQRHVFGPPRLVGPATGAEAARFVDRADDRPAAAQASTASAGDDALTLRLEVAYVVFRTKSNDVSEVFSVGRHLDRVVRRQPGEPLLFADKRIVFDSETILNSIIYPV